MAEPAERFERHCPAHHLPIDDDLRCPAGHRLWVHASRPTVPVWDVYDTEEKRYTYRTRLRPKLKVVEGGAT